MKAWKLSPLVMTLIGVNAVAIESTGFALGSGFTVTPAVEINIENNDNIYVQADKKASSTITRVKPSLALAADLGKTTMNALYSVDQGAYSKDADDNYLDQRISADVTWAPLARHAIFIDASVNKAHDNRGSGTVEGANALTSDADEYNETNAGLNYTFGSASSKANIDVYAKSYQKRYTNNEDIGTEERDHNKANFGALLTVNASSATQVLFEVSNTGISYEQDVSSGREGSLQKLLTGLRWDITGKTTGEVKIGCATRYFNDDGVDSNVRLNWAANVTWQPVQYSSVALSSSQNNNETNGAGSYIANNFHQASWGHTFGAKFSAGVEASLSNDTYVDDSSVNGSGREDALTSYGVRAVYSPMRWIDVKASLKQANRDSNNNTLDYDNQVINLGVSLSL